MEEIAVNNKQQGLKKKTNVAIQTLQLILALTTEVEKLQERVNILEQDRDYGVNYGPMRVGGA